MTSFRIASVALAASAIIASNPAAANGFKTQNSFSNAPLVKKQIAAVNGINARRALPVTRTQFANGHRFNRGVRSNRFARNSFQQTVQLKRHALASCTAQLRRDAYSFGYRGAQLTGADVQQVGRNKFVVHAGAKLYDGYSFSHEPYNCTVAHGHVIDAYKPKKLRF